MDLLEIASIVLLMMVRLDLALVQMAILGVGWPVAFCIIVTWSTVWLIVIYKFTGFLEKKILTSKVKKAIENWPGVKSICKFRRKVRKNSLKRKEKILAWFLNHSKFALFIIFFLPFTPWVDTIAVIAGRLMKIQYGLLIFLILNFIRMTIITIVAF